MFKNYFKTAWRSLTTNKFYSLLNISGLAVGLATGIMLLLWVQSEFSYDKFHTKAKDIFHINAELPTSGKPMFWSGVPAPLSVLAKKIPEIKSVVRITGGGQMLADATESKVLTGNNIICVDSGFLSMFDFALLKGSKETLLSNINSIALTRTTARKLFGTEDAVGKIVKKDNDNFTVVAIMKDCPENASLRFDAIIPMAYYARNFTRNGGNGDWKTIDVDMGNYGFDIYVLLNANANPSKVSQAFTDLYKEARDGDSKTTFHLQNLEDLHLVSTDGSKSALRMVQIMLLVAIILLVIASINYVNLSTARALIRVKEVSVRKIVGAERKQLFLQFTIETVVLFCVAILLALGLIFLLMPMYNSVSGKELKFSLLSLNVWKAIGLAGLITLILSSIYPALLLSSFDPIRSLKGKIRAGIGVVAFRKVLVVFQFTISVILFVCTLVMGKQMKYIQEKDLGYDKSYVFRVAFPDNVPAHLDAIKTALLQESAVKSVGISSEYDISDVGSGSGDIEWPGKLPTTQMIISEIATEKDFLPTLKIPFLEGSDFSGTPSDSNKYILNETAVKQMGLKPPYVGTPIVSHSKKGVILGVVKDFNFQPLTKAVGPLLFNTFWRGNVFYVRTTAANAQAAINATKREYKKYTTVFPFSYDFLDKAFDAHYRAQERTGTLFNVFAGVAIFISCLGLFGLATYTAQVKIKEVGIRKVLGASVSSIVLLISKDFIKLILIAIIIAVPISYLWMNSWLEHFAYRTTLSWLLFALSAIVVILIAVATMCIQALKAALANPVKSLRAE